MTRISLHAPEFPEGLTWLGTSAPLKLKALRGSVVILDFWTFCCINCMHVLTMLRDLEEAHRDDPLVVIGVHSAKFRAERDPERVRDAMKRYGVRHPVVVDEGMSIWQSYAIRAWPSLVFIRPDGTIAGVAPGEPAAEELNEVVQGLLMEARFEKTLTGAPTSRARDPEPSTEALSFPGKVVSLPEGGLLVSDSGHHRLLLLEDDGRVRTTIGSGEPGLKDGPSSSARFSRPQGLVTDGKTLYVADTGNHALRAVDLATLAVTTLAGDGTLGRQPPSGFRPALEVRLRSPWDLALVHDYLLVAMAGAHQIWLYLPDEKAIAVLAGAGPESIDDGSFAQATFSQPTGLAVSGSSVYVADSETSAVRAMDVDARTVRTLVGKGLFDFGDEDGPPARARLQHVQAVSFGPHGVLVADTYNDKIKKVDVGTGRVETWYAGKGDLALAEPGGLCQLPNGDVVVADTNHHRLLLIQEDGRTASVLSIREAARAPSRAQLPAVRVTPEPDEVGAGTAQLHLVLTPPQDLDLVGSAPLDIQVSVTSGHGVISIQGDAEPLDASGSDSALVQVSLQVTPAAEATDAEVRVRVGTMICAPGDIAACWPVDCEYRIPLKVNARASSRAIVARLPLPRPEGALT